ncbi:9229_t:CDS:2 [Funneliformis geosporum]|uniref:8965_t:CDS:1 n=1 Tax=Funneliformis geosporum TaxID=1117311 RepID=A0A9W4SZ26_9GLOM|nr:9229_t:CDS:2 [Funneliformis geosporum]CAI2186907.1 8965_t:CDS:2 [Funneliformis geosporum]
MAEEIATTVELNTYSEPPTIITEDEDGNTYVEVSSEEMKKLNLLYRKGFSNAVETLAPVELKVSGELPAWLSGELYTVGPGIYDIKYNRMIESEGGGYESATETFSMGHWFDALPFVNRFELDGKNNKIKYRSRITSRKYETKIRDHHGIVTKHPFTLFKTHVNQTPLAKLFGQKRTDKPEMEPCSINISTNFPFYKSGEKPKVFCQNHASQVVELEAYDLSPSSVYSWDDINPLFRGNHASPHPHYDENTGELINFNMEIQTLGTRYNFFSISENHQSGEFIASVSAKASYVHSFAVVFPFYGKNAGINVKWSDSILDSLSYKPEEPTIFYVISRVKKQHIATYKSAPCFAFHHINAFEDDDDNLYLDIVCYDNTDICYDLSLENLRNGLVVELPLAEVRRFVLQNIQIESVKFSKMPQTTQLETLQNTVVSLFRNVSYQSIHPWPIANYVRCADSTLELPRINPKFHGLRYRYVYGIGLSAKAATQEGQIWDALIKCDLDTKEVVAMWVVENCYPSEPVFISAPGNDNNEDDGILLSVIFDGHNIKSYLVVLDAKTLLELARIDLPQVIPLSFGHGSFKQ